MTPDYQNLLTGRLETPTSGHKISLFYTKCLRHVHLAYMGLKVPHVFFLSGDNPTKNIFLSGYIPSKMRV